MSSPDARGRWTSLAIGLGAALALTACSGGTASEARVEPTYDRDGRLRQIEYDSNNNGRPDVRVFMNGNRPQRSEVDSNEDGRVERWEHFDEKGVVTKVGTASHDDGIEDTWSYPGPDGEVVRVERITPAGQVWRRELFDRDGVTRIEEDSNHDGQMDRWESHRDGVVVGLELDTSLSRGRPDRRLVYGAGGALERIEVDADGDGTFEALVSR